MVLAERKVDSLAELFLALVQVWSTVFCQK